MKTWSWKDKTTCCFLLFLSCMMSIILHYCFVENFSPNSSIVFQVTKFLGMNILNDDGDQNLRLCLVLFPVYIYVPYMNMRMTTNYIYGMYSSPTQGDEGEYNHSIYLGYIFFHIFMKSQIICIWCFLYNHFVASACLWFEWHSNLLVVSCKLYKS